MAEATKYMTGTQGFDAVASTVLSGLNAVTQGDDSKVNAIREKVSAATPTANNKASNMSSVKKSSAGMGGGKR